MGMLPNQSRGISAYTPVGRTPFLQVLTAMAFLKTGRIFYLATVPLFLKKMELIHYLQLFLISLKSFDLVINYLQ